MNHHRPRIGLCYWRADGAPGSAGAAPRGLADYPALPGQRAARRYRSGPDFETLNSFPLTDNDDATTRRVAAAFSAHFGDSAVELSQQTASEDFSDIPRAAGIPYTYWGIGGTDPATYRTAEKAGRVQDDIPVNHSPKFLPVLQPTLRTGTET